MNAELLNTLEKNHLEQFGKIDQKVFSSGRINVLGEHIDYNDGIVLPAGIQLGVYMVFSYRKDTKIHVEARDLKESYLDDLEGFSFEKSNDWRDYVKGMIVILELRPGQGANISFSSDLPIGMGLSSSAALSNALGKILNQAYSLNFTNLELATKTVYLEREYIGLECGIMDPFASFFAKKDELLILDCENETWEYLPFSKDYKFLLINSGGSHNLRDSEYNRRRETCRKILGHLKLNSFKNLDLNLLGSNKDRLSQVQYKRARYITEEFIRVKKAVNAIKNNDYRELGSLMNATHLGLKNLYEVSTKDLDELQKWADSVDGVLGSRLMGGGFGGCTLNLIQANKQREIIKQIPSGFDHIVVEIGGGTYTF